jgi:glycosyltransferase involved in cell wall biosynthesis
MKNLTIAVCTYNRADNLKRLAKELRSQFSPIPFDILFINNNSRDNTEEILKELRQEPGVKLRYVNEHEQGITFARNRALKESMESDYLLFLDDDEIPSSPQMVEAAITELENGDVQCVGGKVIIYFEDNTRPKWLTDELLGFYAEIDYGDEPFIIHDESTPIWTSIIAYDMSIFRDDEELRFDNRYNRIGIAIGGGSDEVMFKAMLRKGIKMKYVPKMGVLHFVESWRMTRRYFWKLHFISGRKRGQFESPDYRKTVFGIPPFLFRQFIGLFFKSFVLFLKTDPNYVRQGMNATHALGMIYGRYLRWKSLPPSRQSNVK